MNPETSSLSTRYWSIKERVEKAIEINHFPINRVLLIAVSKNKPSSDIEELYRLGHKNFGENYAQELIQKAEELKNSGIDDIKWHFIGHLQTNKVKAIISKVHAIHTIDSLKLAQEISRQMSNKRPNDSIQVFIEVNIDEETSKHGVDPSMACALAKSICSLPGLTLSGLMAIPNPMKSPQNAFKKLAALEQKCRPYTLGLLSMGMSEDFETAILEGATHIRVGSALFGSR